MIQERLISFYLSKTLRQLRVIAWNKGIAGSWAWGREQLVAELIRWDCLFYTLRNS